MLTKYPVKGKLNDYKVDVIKDHVALGLYSWVVKIYTYHPDKIFKKYKKVYYFESGWSKYEKYIGNYVDLVIDAVSEYENEIIKKQEQDFSHKLGIKEWERWDGYAK